MIRDVMVVCSPGGHLQELYDALPVQSNCRYHLVTFRTGIEGSLDKFCSKNFVEDASRGILSLMQCFFQSAALFFKIKPSHIISSGAGVGIPIMILGRLCRRKIFFLELSCQIAQPSKTGRMAHFLVDAFVVQSKHLLRYFPSAVLVSKYD